ncbi:MAG TPA: tRNA (adenosine(37)-N6)-threonylcarbamoyltransferase complex dimerization subunit type 1 TsaB [Nitrospiraceae bacterium]|nr:tRNA (adenosine(37)-N6)-threonylcarbamoyltransferase complex dimerization subunit type 1 TsaB [Nitrospiraceae bacterium]
MKILAVDTATAYQSVAILDETTVLAQVDKDAKGSHAKSLVMSIDEALRTAKLALRELDGFALSIGPGSFTGLRVGLATVLGFRTILKKPLVAVPTLEAMAWNVRPRAGRICPMLKSRKDEVYWANYEWSSDHRLHRLIPEQVTSPDQVAASIHVPIVALGDGWETHGQMIRTMLGAGAGLVVDAPRDAMHPSAVSVALAARERFARQEFAGNGIAPLYIQRAEADLTYERSGGMSPVERRKQRVARRAHPKYVRPGSEPRRSGQKT